MDIITMVTAARSKEDLDAILETEEWTKADTLSKGFAAQIMMILVTNFRIDSLEERVAKLEHKEVTG